MGMVTPYALGLHRTSKPEVIAFDGDGGILFDLQLGTIAQTNSQIYVVILITRVMSRLQGKTHIVALF